jgi:predicted nucleotidyltransferase
VKHARDIVAPETAERLAAYRLALDAALPGIVKRVLLFGSRARGDAAPDADFDIAVLVRADGIGRSTRSRMADAAFDQMTEGFDLAPVTLPEDYLEPVNGHYRTELARRISAEGVDI